VSVLRVLKHERGRLRVDPAPAYTQLDANLSYTEKLKHTDLTWLIIWKNLLDEEIWISTLVLKDVAPIAGHNVMAGACGVSGSKHTVRSG